MIQDIAPHNFDNSFKNIKPEGVNKVFVFNKNEILTAGENILPQVDQLPGGLDKFRHRLTFLFTIDDEPFFLLQPETLKGKVPAGMEFVPERQLGGAEQVWMSLAAFTAKHLNQWYRSHRFCGSCGSTTIDSDTERARVCPECGSIVYPRINPVVMAAIYDGDRLLVTRYRGRDYKGLALNAGFVEIGEDLESAVRREVMEEVGLEAGKLTYFGSQPWGISGSVISGYFVELKGSDEIKLDEQELSEAVWLNREDIPQQDNPLSITAAMIEAFRNGKY